VSLQFGLSKEDVAWKYVVSSPPEENVLVLTFRSSAVNSWHRNGTYKGQDPSLRAMTL